MIFRKVVVFGLLLIGCSGEPPVAPASAAPAAPEPVAEPVTTSVDVTYTVISDTAMSDVKRSVEIRLSRKVSEDTLRNLALELKSKDPRSYERTFIAYYLPSMQVGAGAWATTDFTPNLKVRILGTTIAEERALKTASAPEGEEFVGAWIDDRPYVASRLTLYRKKGQLIMDQRFQDGSGREIQVRERSFPLGRRLDYDEGSQWGEYWVIDDRGDLRTYDRDGLITTARKVP